MLFPGYNPPFGSNKIFHFFLRSTNFFIDMHDVAGRISETPARGHLEFTRNQNQHGPLSPTGFSVLLRCSGEFS